MRRFVVLVAALATGAVALTSANAHIDAKRTICHRTGSATKPYVKLAVSAAQLRAHVNHPADIVPAPKSGCPRTLLAVDGGTALQTTLVGETESPAGDPVATGTGTVRLRAGQGQLCFKLAATNLSGPAAAAHVHTAAAGAAGPVVVPLATPNADGKAAGCVVVARTLVAAILASPASYYVNVHTAEFPAGAVRGQLGGPPATAGTVLAFDLKGTTEPNATGSAALRFRKDAGLVCYRLRAANVTLPTAAAHIHRGAAGTNGPVVVGFTPPGESGTSSGCAPAVASLIDEILATPSGFYVNVHTKEHPGGAIRSQLG